MMKGSVFFQSHETEASEGYTATVMEVLTELSVSECSTIFTTFNIPING